MSYRDRDRRRDRDDYRGGGDRYGGRDSYGGGRDSYGGGRDSYGGGRDSYGGGRDSYGGGRNDGDRRSRDGGGGGRKFGGGGGGGDMRRKGGGSFGGGGGGGGGGYGGGGGRGRSGSFGRGGGGGGGRSRDGKRMGGPRNGPPEKRYKNESSNWNDDERHGLMQSIFMETKPENFEEDWVFVVCPPGKRRLLVAASETTQSYNNAGAQDIEFQSCLPSGCDVRGELDKISDITILDTVYSAEKKMFYIVDMLHWKHYPYYDTEADFRFYCLNDKWAQLNSPDQTSENNEYPLHKLEKRECTDAKILEAIKEFDGKVEGLLFIKKKALYKFRESIECLWLKLDKLEKVLGFEVPEGVSFATSNAKDEKRMQEQEQRKKQYEDRVAAREKKEKEKEAAAADGQKEGDESKQEGEEAEGENAPEEEEENEVPVEEDAPEDNGEANEDQEMTEDGDGN